MTQRTFYSVFRAAWEDSFTVQNIEGGWRKTGIWPCSPPIALDAIQRRPKTPDVEGNSNKPPPTPMTSKSIRRAQRAYRSNPTKTNLEVILKSQEKLAAQHEVDRYFL